MCAAPPHNSPAQLTENKCNLMLMSRRRQGGWGAFLQDRCSDHCLLWKICARLLNCRRLSLPLLSTMFLSPPGGAAEQRALHSSGSKNAVLVMEGETKRISCTLHADRLVHSIKHIVSLFKCFIYSKVWTLRTAEFQKIYEQFPFYFV